MSANDLSAQLHGEALLAAKRPELQPLIDDLREVAQGRDDLRAECAGTIAGSWFASAARRGEELIAAGLLMLAAMLIWTNWIAGSRSVGSVGAARQCHTANQLTDRRAITAAVGRQPSAGCLALHSSHPAERFLPSLVRLINGQARSQRDLGLPAQEEGLNNRRYLQRVCQVEDDEERALAVLNEEVKGFRLQEFSQTLECSLTRCARAETFANVLVKGFSVHDSFEQHPHDNLQMSRAAVSARMG
jgi:hypothetical protein